jgi:hypothetical protein
MWWAGYGHRGGGEPESRVGGHPRVGRIPRDPACRARITGEFGGISSMRATPGLAHAEGSWRQYHETNTGTFIQPTGLRAVTPEGREVRLALGDPRRGRGLATSTMHRNRARTKPRRKPGAIVLSRASPAHFKMVPESHRNTADEPERRCTLAPFQVARLLQGVAVRQRNWSLPHHAA